MKWNLEDNIEAMEEDLEEVQSLIAQFVAVLPETKVQKSVDVEPIFAPNRILEKKTPKTRTNQRKYLQMFYRKNAEDFKYLWFRLLILIVCIAVWNLVVIPFIKFF